MRFAIRLIKTELYKPSSLSEGTKSEVTGECSCALRQNYLLPCRHVLPGNNDVATEPQLFNERWHLKDVEGNSTFNTLYLISIDS